MGDLAAATHQSAASMTGIVDRLLEEGLVERRRDPEDRRSVIVALTQEGARVLDQARADRRHTLEQLLRLLSPEDRAQLRAILEKLLEGIEADADERG